MYTEADLEVFTPEFRLYLRRAAQALCREERVSRGTQLNMALAYWLADRRSY